ncbi:fibronectin type III domain-containing protein [Luteolibacter ambystomatis]|uniref:Fibronectin type III domain-containing protein n=1 Tax=Luteolibacter ambystomatis TaxID=2824561 RepID=A0A975J1V0_9BACT|nr:fibronectin type III domain-containing protein [Luteolibacter ambystomatis]QUE52429.1 fibronectin type III domain-containing protein [Luteolibacter ambystomatis]
MNRAQFLRLSALGTFGLATRGLAFPSGYTGIPSGIRPYLQTPRPDSMWVSWFSDNAPSGLIEWGSSPGALVNSVAADLDVLGSGYNYHAGRITGLSPNSYYYYRVSNGSTVSEVFRFRTPPPAGTKTGRMRVLVMGDNQIIAENRYEKLIACAKAKIESLYNKPIEEVIDFILMPGDQVDVGTLDHYRNLHFKQCGLISPNIPIMTTIGNHETYYDTGMNLYGRIFRYDDINYGGVTSPGGEKYYSYQLANIAFVHTSSEHTGAEQKGWVRSLVDVLKTDSTTDLCISVCHRPYQAEQYVGDISGWFRSDIMPIFAETEKHVMNIGAHHHLYARGQTREWPIYHIISGGTAWDQYWGQSTELDMDDVQKTIANWAWQLMDFDLAARRMDVTCYSEANVRLPAATRWNYDSRMVDSFHRQLGLALPSQPSLTNTFSAPVTLPLSLQCSAFATSTAETLNSTWFQVASDAAFTSLKVDKIRDFENLYGDTGAPLYEPVDINAGINLLQFPLAANSLPNGSYYTRVRHRDSNAAWSPWSASKTFEVTGSVVADPKITLAKKVYAYTENFSVVYENGPGNAKDWIGIYKKGQSPGPVASTSWQYVSGKSGTLNFTTDLAAGQEWFAAFFANDGYTEVAPRVPFYVGSTPTLTTDKTAYAEGETVNVTFANAPGSTKDWIGIYKVGQTPGVGGVTSTAYQYTPAASGTKSFANLPKGYYYAVYLVNDGYFEISQRVAFSVGSQISSVSMASNQVPSGQDFTVNFSNGPGIPKDYLGIFKQGETPGVDVLTAYLYFDGKTNGSATFHLPNLAPGNYFVAMYTNDSYTEVSNRYNFTVVAPTPLKLEQSSIEGNQMRLRFSAQPGKNYTVQRSVDLQTWQPVRTVVPSSSSHEELVDFDRSINERCFFRILLQE